MKLAAILLLLCWGVAVIDMVADPTSWWSRTLREAKRRARELKW